ncbi:MAG: crossover junction endodeoxyribonuclease RuvC [Anaerolineales bacterium]|nr:crossover junction endodeoxyribonuclease RuvC [Anaerolineales bacterium]MCX7608174.1 crossover junction endodeoxyribonuclease RuvC [Anaerolineales bacterium]MDW8226504.1 crossover junction endodeoxyribonuclease RuvC [Anaerolineales bacterium]
MTLVLGIDPGTAATGFGLVRTAADDRLEMVAYGVLQTPAGESAAQRLLLLYQQLNQLLLLHRPQAVAVEKLFFQRNISTAMAVGQARGVVLLAAAQAGLPVFEYTPNEVKQAIAGYGSAQKRQVQEMLRVLLSLPELPRPDDAADALAVAITHLNTQRFV